MLVQSNGGKVYAVLANNDNYELGLLPGLTLQSTTLFLNIRCRYKAMLSEYFDPMLVPKRVLVGGIERSANTLRGTVMLNTGFTIEKVGKGFPDIVSQKLFDAAPGYLIGLTAAEGECLSANDLRDDFVKDFAQLVTSAIAPIYPAKDFSGTSTLLTAFDLMLYGETVASAPKSPFAALDGGKPADTGAPVTKLPLKGGDDEPPAPEPEADPAPEGEPPTEDEAEPKGVDKSPYGEPKMAGKVHIIGQALKDHAEEPETT